MHKYGMTSKMHLRKISLNEIQFAYNNISIVSVPCDEF